MKIIYSTKAKKQIRKISKKKKIEILKKTVILGLNPFLGKKLKGEFKGQFSFKAWPYRIIYQVNKRQKIIYIVTIKHRQNSRD